MDGINGNTYETELEICRDEIHKEMEDFERRLAEVQRLLKERKEGEEPKDA